MGTIEDILDYSPFVRCWHATGRGVEKVIQDLNHQVSIKKLFYLRNFNLLFSL